MPGPVLWRHPSSLEHDPGPHPEQPARVVAIDRMLEARGGLGWESRLSPAASRELLEAVHAPALVTAIEELCAAGGGMIDQDTIVSPGSWEAALHAAGGAAAMVDALLGDEARVGASLHRPPGHHAERARAMGFCLFNNVAVAARRARDAHGVRRVLVVDWDVHHGNGTQEIFFATDDVLFVSIHESPLYPGTGAAGETGVGDGAGFTVNLPVPAGSGDAVFGSLVEHVVGPVARAYAPGLILVSAGYDAAVEDPLAGCVVTEEGFAAMAASVRALAAELGVSLGLVLEGGYDLDALSGGVAATLDVLGADVAPAPPDVPVHPLARAALERVGATSPLA